jgi:hypothetical protein
VLRWDFLLVDPASVDVVEPTWRYVAFTGQSSHQLHTSTISKTKKAHLLILRKCSRIFITKTRFSFQLFEKMHRYSTQIIHRVEPINGHRRLPRHQRWTRLGHPRILTWTRGPTRRAKRSRRLRWRHIAHRSLVAHPLWSIWRQHRTAPDMRHMRRRPDLAAHGRLRMDLAGYTATDTRILGRVGHDWRLEWWNPIRRALLLRASRPLPWHHLWVACWLAGVGPEPDLRGRGAWHTIRLRSGRSHLEWASRSGHCSKSAWYRCRANTVCHWAVWEHPRPDCGAVHESSNGLLHSRCRLPLVLLL